VPEMKAPGDCLRGWHIKSGDYQAAWLARRTLTLELSGCLLPPEAVAKIRCRLLAHCLS
jgi:hypothetical protein